MSRIIAVDVGEKRTGIAISDPLNIIAQPLEIVKTQDLFIRLKSLIKEYEVGKIVIGMPLNMNGTKGEKALHIESVADCIEKDLSVKVEKFDERLTTVQGERMLIEADISRKKRKKAIDKIAAQIILQAYLEKCTEN